MCGMLAHLVVYVGALAWLAIVGDHLWDELLEKTEAYWIFRHPEGGRQDVLWAHNAEIRARCCLASQASPEKSRLRGTPQSGAKMLVFMQLFRLAPHYVMRCGPIDLVAIRPRRLR